jgi:hypothetical protein
VFLHGQIGLCEIIQKKVTLWKGVIITWTSIDKFGHIPWTQVIVTWIGADMNTCYLDKGNGSFNRGGCNLINPWTRLNILQLNYSHNLDS